MSIPRSSVRLAAVAAILAVTLVRAPAQESAGAADPALERLRREIARLSEASGGVTGATIVHLETGRRVSLHESERFPMASTFKVPVAVQLLTRVDKGELKLDQMIEMRQSDLHPGSGTVADLFNKPGLALSVRNLLELMLLISDNSAADVCLRLAGGPDTVTARMRELGIDGIDVNRSTARLIADWVGISNLPPEEKWTPALFQSLFAGVTAEQQKLAATRFDADRRDTSTPGAMAALLERIHRKDILKPDTSDLLLDIMRRCRTGEGRLRGILPAGTELAHKTGTIGGTANDVGIMTLPDGAHIAIAVFVKRSEKDVPARERVIAEIARASHDFFLFNPR